MSDELTKQIRDLKNEVQAMQFWMRELFAVNSFGHVRENIEFIEKRTAAIKNMDNVQASPPEITISPSAYDEYVTTVVPHIIRISEDIVYQLKRFEQ